MKPFLKKKAFMERTNISFSQGFLFREKVVHHEDAKRAVVIPKYDEIPVTVIRNNMRTVGMTRVEYFSILRRI